MFFPCNCTVLRRAILTVFCSTSVIFRLTHIYLFCIITVIRMILKPQKRTDTINFIFSLAADEILYPL